MLSEGEKFERTPIEKEREQEKEEEELEREEVEREKKEPIEGRPEEVEVKGKVELSEETRDEIKEFLNKGFEKARRRVEEYEREQERQKELPYEKRRHIDVDEAVYERTAVYTPYMKFSDALKGFKKGDFPPVIEVLERFKTEEEERLESYRGVLNQERLNKILSREWDRLSKEKKEEINKKIEEVDTKIETLRQKRMKWAEQLRDFLE